MKYIVITDTHFGWSQNSITWLNSMTGFFYNQLIPYIKQLKSRNEKFALIHCGDVFESRSTINTMIAYNVRNIFKTISDIMGQDIYIIAGNHDFYSPNDDSIDSINLYLNNIDGVNIIVNKEFWFNDDLFVPWYVFEDYDKLEKIIRNKKPRRIFCHTDLQHLKSEYYKLLNGIKVYSGHIHQEWKRNDMINLCSTFALTFADSNSEHGFYIVDTDTDELTFIKSENTIRFWRLNNEEIFDIDIDSMKNDRVELYIDKINLLNDKFVERISDITSVIKCVTVIPNQEQTQISESVEFANYDISDICKKNIPEHLQQKFSLIS